MDGLNPRVRIEFNWDFTRNALGAACFVVAGMETERRVANLVLLVRLLFLRERSRTLLLFVAGIGVDEGMGISS
jgi:hypothetical protein